METNLWMQKTLAFLCIMVLCGCDNINDNDPCEDFYGSYSGTLDGEPMNATISFTVVSGSSGEYNGVLSAEIEGVWFSPNGYVGTMGSHDALACETGNVATSWTLEGPQDLLCETRDCAVAGLGIDKITGLLTSQSGTGIWRIESGAARDIGLSGTGAWTVSRQ